MATKAKHHPVVVVSTLNPDAPLFVPAVTSARSARSARSATTHAEVVEDFSGEWWSLVQTCREFREQWMQDRVPAVEDQEIFEAEIEEIADLDAFLEYQEEMQELEESFCFEDFDTDAFRTRKGAYSIAIPEPEVVGAVVQIL